MHHLVRDHDAGVVEMRLDLRPGLGGDLRRGALPRAEPVEIPRVLQSDRIADRQSLTVPSPYEVSGRFQNWASLIEVRPQPEST